MKPCRRAGKRRRVRAPDGPGGRQRQTLIAAPGGADAEQGEGIDHRDHRFRADIGLEDDAEQAAGAGVIALPDGMPGGAGKGGVKDAPHLRPLTEPARDANPRFHLVIEPDRERAHAAEREPAIIGARILAEGERRSPHPLPVLVGAGGDGAEQQVGMAADIFRQRLQRDIDAMGEGLEEMDAPGIVHQHLDAAGMGGLGQRRHVLHLEAVAAGALQKQNPRRRAAHQAEGGGIDGRRVVGGGDAETAQHGVAKMPRWAIDTVRHQAVITGFEIGHQREGAGGEARGDDLAARAALDLGDRVLEGEMGRRPEQAIDQRLFEPMAAGGGAVGAGGVEHRRAAHQGWVDEAVGARRGAPDLNEAGIGAERRARLVFGHGVRIPSACRDGSPIPSTSRHRARLGGSRQGRGRG